MVGALSTVFGSVLARLALIYGALAILTATAIAVAWFVFQSIATNMEVLSSERLPELRNSASIVAAAEAIEDVLAKALISTSTAELNSLSAEAVVLIRNIREQSRSFPSEKATELNRKIDRVETALSELKAARKQMFNSNAAVAQSVREAKVAAEAATSILTTQSDSAYFNLVLGSDDTVTAVGDTLSKLVEEDFALFQTTLEAQSEVNLLSGIALSAAQTRDQALLSILEDVARSSFDRLTSINTRLAADDTTSELVQTIDAAIDTFGAGLLTRGARSAPSSILQQRQIVMSALSSAYDDIYFQLVINSDDAKTENEKTIRELIDVQVGNIRAQAALDSAAKSFIASVMQTALTRSTDELAGQSQALSASADALQRAMEGASEEVQATLLPMLTISDAEKGIVSIRQQAFDAEQMVSAATQQAAAAVGEITQTISVFSNAAQNSIDENAQALSSEIAAARDWMKKIGLVSVILTVIAPLLIWRMISEPLKRVTAATERLASGDLSEVTGLSTGAGEIGQMARALHVFRDGALERMKMQEEEKDRQAKAFEAEQEAERAKREAAEREQRAESERLDAERAREAREQQRIEEDRKATEAERQARAAEQDAVVSALASSLKRLSAGDFTQTITTEFPGSYETLRQDFNAAIENLADLVRTISQSAGTIDAGSSEIAASSLDLSRRTESAAATLEETAAALNELTASVASAAKGASSASATVETVKDNARSSHEVMQDAVSAMTEIQTSSNKIAKIVEVIDSIAFQTNLLALNAGVEAARAGEAGRGFAVVASEVRILAHRCSDAATQINTLISESSGHVNAGVDRLDLTQKALDDIVSGINEMSKSVADIAVSTNEQSGGINEINTAVEQLDRSTQQNAAMFEETTAASQTLTHEASELATLIAGFKVPSSASDPETSDGEQLPDDHDIPAAG